MAYEAITGALGAVNEGISDMRKSRMALYLKNVQLHQQMELQANASRLAQGVEQEKWAREEAVSPGMRELVKSYMKQQGMPELSDDQINNSNINQILKMAALNNIKTAAQAKASAAKAKTELSPAVIADLVARGVPPEVAATMSQQEANYFKNNPSAADKEMSHRIMASLPTLKAYGDELSKIFGEGTPMEQKRARIAMLSDSQWAAAFSPRLGSLRSQLISKLGPIDAGKAMTTLEKQGVMASLGSGLTSKKDISEAVDNVFNRYIDETLVPVLEGTGLGEGRLAAVKKYNKIAGLYGRPPLGAYQSKFNAPFDPEIFKVKKAEQDILDKVNAGSYKKAQAATPATPAPDLGPTPQQQADADAGLDLQRQEDADMASAAEAATYAPQFEKKRPLTDANAALDDLLNETDAPDAITETPMTPERNKLYRGKSKNRALRGF